MKLEINVGSIKANYTLCLTDAPRAYDVFGTVNIIDYGQPVSHPARLVAIREEHLAYQTGRYGSGLHCAWDGDEEIAGALHLTLRDIEEILFLRLFKVA